MTDPYTQPVPEAAPQTDPSTAGNASVTSMPDGNRTPPGPDSAHPAEPVFDDNGNIEARPEAVPFGTPITREQDDGSTFFSRTYTVPTLDHDIENLRNVFKNDVGEGFTFTSIRVDVDVAYGDVTATDGALVSEPTYTAVVEGVGKPIETPKPFQP